MIRFIHIPKTAGTTVEKALRSSGVQFLVGTGGSDNKKIADRHARAHRYASETVPRFSVVRNPYTRLLSHYGWMRRLNTRLYKQYSFARFVDEQFNVGRAYRAWITQAEYLYAPNLPGRPHSECLVSTILRFETLAEDLHRQFGVTRTPHLNRTDLDPRDYYGDREIERVQQHFGEDFELFNYPLNPPWL